MQFVSAHDYTGENAWDALDLVAFDQPATVRLHWTNEPYAWHVNDGEEVFVVLDGEVEMRFRDHGLEKTQVMRAGDICRAGLGDEHVAHPRGEARILVVERLGSI
jgi:mannose-6-phosphate isomerase-like protein (cupin superfamily)